MNTTMDDALKAPGCDAGAAGAPSVAQGRTESTRLFTHKVADDDGSAPNPYCGVCTLALSVPRIRQEAEPGDLVAGFGCRSSADPDEEFRVVYVMQVDEVLTWPHYIARCRRDLPGKIPATSSPERRAGDCIYPLDGGRIGRIPLASGSGHDAASYPKDVEAGVNVLMARCYWYFGAGDQHRLVVPAALRDLSPSGQGHQSRKNTFLIPGFIGWFNTAVALLALAPGVHGTPKVARPLPGATSPIPAQGGARGSS